MEKNKDFSFELRVKEILESNNGLHTEYWNCWLDHCNYNHVNKLCQIGVFRREYGDCELGLKCPIK